MGARFVIVGGGAAAAASSSTRFVAGRPLVDGCRHYLDIVLPLATSLLAKTILYFYLHVDSRQLANKLSIQ